MIHQNVHCKRIMDCMGEGQLLAWGPISLLGWNIFKKKTKNTTNQLLCFWSGQSTIFHQARFPWNNWISLNLNATFWGYNRFFARFGTGSTFKTLDQGNGEVSRLEFMEGKNTEKGTYPKTLKVWYIYPRSPKTIKRIYRFSPKTIVLVGNLNHPKLGTIILIVGWTSRV